MAYRRFKLTVPALTEQHFIHSFRRDKKTMDEVMKDPAMRAHIRLKSKDRRTPARKRAEYLASAGTEVNSTELWGQRTLNSKLSFSRTARRSNDAKKLNQLVRIVHKSTKTSEHWDRQQEWEEL